MQSITIVPGLLDGKSSVIQIPHTWVAGHREISLKLDGIVLLMDSFHSDRRCCEVSRVENASLKSFSVGHSYHNSELMIMVCPLVPCGITVVVGSNHFLIVLRATPQGESHVWYCMPCLKPMNEEVICPRKESAIVLQNVKLPSKEFTNIYSIPSTVAFNAAVVIYISSLQLFDCKGLCHFFLMDFKI